MTTWKDAVVSPATPLLEAIAKVDASAQQVALVLHPDGRLAGVLTDGDVRRAILRGRNLQTPVSEVMNSTPTSVPASTSRDEMLALMRRTSFHHLPLVDEANRVVGLVTLDELVGAVERPNWVVLMAGGLGTRLQPLTDERPKPLLTVSGKPILESILESFVAQGFKRIFLSINYKAEMIRDHFGSGERWGVQVEYLHESTSLGTAGSLSLLTEQPSSSVVVMNGDLLTRINFDNLLQFHHAQGAAATMAVREYEFQVPFGVVQLQDSHVARIDEKPLYRQFVNAGIYVLSPEVLPLVPCDTHLNMTDLLAMLITSQKRVAAYPVTEYWLDVGRLEELQRAQQDWVRADR